MNNRDWMLLMGFVGGALTHQFFKNRVTIRFVYESPVKDFAQEMLFDCPVCGLPSELEGILTQMNELDGYEKYFVLNCLGDNHDQVAATEQWFKENVGKM